MKNLKLGTLSIPITQFASQGNAVLGIRDSGKSYSATYLAEQLYAASIPFVAFDPSGVWKFLRVPGAGAGLPVVVAGGKAPDLPLTPQSAPEIVRAAMRANVSLVLDLYDIHMSKADWSRIVEACVRVLLYENGEHGLRHIFIEEAAEFAPQQVSGDKARVYAEVEKLARIGGNALLGYTLINQRAEQVNKAVLELCDCLLLHRQKGKNSLNSLSKWLEYSQGGDTKEIIKGLPTLPSGECWVWPAGAEHATHVKMPQKNTFHPDRRALIANPAAANVKRIDASKFVAELRGSLEKYVEEAKANDPAELKKYIRELERQAASKPDVAPSPELLQAAEQRGYAAGHAIGFEDAIQEATKFIGRVQGEVKDLNDDMQQWRAEFERNAQAAKANGARPENPQRRVSTHRPAEALQERRTGTALTVARSQRQIDGRAPTEGKRTVEQKILNALGELEQLGAGTPPREMVAFLAGYSNARSAGFVKALGSLSVDGLVSYPNGGEVALTDAGAAKACPPPKPRTSTELQERIVEMLGGVSGKILQPLLNCYPDPMERTDIAAAADYGNARSAGFVKALGRLSVLGFVKYPGSGTVAAAPILFLER